MGEKNRVTRVNDRIPIRRVLVSVSDKSGLDVFVSGLLDINPDLTIYSTGGTHTAIASLLGDRQRKNLVEVSAYTGQPETQGGLVKTLDFKIHLGILTEEFNADHDADLLRLSAVRFDMIVVNLYPFSETVARPGADLEDARGNIDIGGPTMLRGSAKNFLRVAAVCSPSDYPSILDELRNNAGTLSLRTRFSLAQRAFLHTAEYDGHISAYLSKLSAEAVLTVYNTEPV